MLLEVSARLLGQRFKITGYDESRSHYRQKLLALGLTPGTIITLKRFAPLGDPVEVALRGFSLSLRKDEINLLHVEPFHAPAIA